MQQVRPQLFDLYEGQTEQMPAFLQRRLVLPDPRRNTEPLLPLDELCRPYVASHKKWDRCGLLWDDTIIQTMKLVERYCSRSGGKYPTEIVLCAGRYFVRRAERFYPWDMMARPIPFRYENADASYEILVRGIV